MKQRLSFSTSLPTLQFARDSTSLGLAKACPRKYQYTIVMGYKRKRGVPDSLHLRYGTLYHRALEVYDHKVFEGMGHDEALKFSLRDLAEGCQDWAQGPCISPEEVQEYKAGTDGDGQRYKFVQIGADFVDMYKRTGWWDPNEGLTDE